MLMFYLGIDMKGRVYAYIFYLCKWILHNSFLGQKYIFLLTWKYIEYDIYEIIFKTFNSHFNEVLSSLSELSLSATSHILWDRKIIGHFTSFVIGTPQGFAVSINMEHFFLHLKTFYEFKFWKCLFCYYLYTIQKQIKEEICLMLIGKRILSLLPSNDLLVIQGNVCYHLLNLSLFAYLKNFHTVGSLTKLGSFY